MSLNKDTHADGIHTVVNRISDVTTRAQDAIIDTATKAKNAAEVVAQKTVDTLDEGRGAAAQVLAKAASAIRDDATNISGGVTSVVNSTVAQMDATATYVRRRTIRQMTRDLTRLVKRHPAFAVMIAAALGVVVGRAIAQPPPPRQAK
jgi:ElaB/YqjD/DUF883 family membrane-anchored ribosome-binding protein